MWELLQLLQPRWKGTSSSLWTVAAAEKYKGYVQEREEEGDDNLVDKQEKGDQRGESVMMNEMKEGKMR